METEMSLGAWFWILMALWALFGLAWNSNPTILSGWGWLPNWFLLFMLFVILGWKVFGSAIHG